MKFNETFLKSVIYDAQIMHEAWPEECLFSADSRSIQPGEIFIALVGKRHDGHVFIKEAFEKQASGCILQDNRKHILHDLDQSMLKNKLVILVPDTTQALRALAAAWRSQFDYPVVGITGSLGKTTTKYMIAHVLQLSGKNFLASYDDQSSANSLSLNLLRMRREHEVAIFEMGITRRGQMTQLVALAKPTSAVITNVAHAHMEGLGSIVDIAHEKRDIFNYFTESNIGIVNGDQKLLAQVAYNYPIIKFGAKTTNQVQARKIHVRAHGVEFTLKLYHKKYQVTLPKNHMGNVFNALAAASVGYFLNLPDEIIIKGIQQPVNVSRCFELLPMKQARGTIINDTYNANPESMKAALHALEDIDTKAQKIVVLGDMAELGVNSPFWHCQLGRFFRKVPSLRKVVLVGDMVKWTQKTIPVGVQVELVPSWQDAVTTVKKLTADESLILVKGSHAMQLDCFVNEFTR